MKPSAANQRISPLPLLGLLLAFGLAACVPMQEAAEVRAEATPTAVESPMIRSLKIIEVRLDRSFYRPGERIAISVHIKSQVQEPSTVRLTAAIRHLTKVVGDIERTIGIRDGEATFKIDYTPPAIAPRGYGLDLCLETEDGRELACESTAFDVLEHWTQSPRYGFLSDFSPGREDTERTMADLTRYHINGLQFYDWMYRHDQFLTDEDPYRDPLGRRLSRTTVEALIAASHEHNIAAMPYTAIYAASVPFYEAHPDWALYQASGEPYRLGDDFLIYMDPRPASPWVEHLLGQFEQLLTALEFDGIHLDQYGDPKAAQDARGVSFALDKPLAATIDATADLVKSLRPDGAVVFNAVNNWPIEAVAPSAQDIVYIEVWPPHIWFQDLHSLIVNAQELGGGKPVILAAYLDPSFEHNARLLDAVIFASGAGHIELGEHHAMLADPYFPNFKIMSPELASAMSNYYDFAVRYQDVLGGRTEDATRGVQSNIDIEGVLTQPNLSKDKIWPIARQGEGFLAVSLINLLGLDSPEWASEIEAPPTSLQPTSMTIRGLHQAISRLWFASPDTEDPSPQMIPFETLESDGGYAITFKLPFLEYWDLLVLEWIE